MDYQRHYNLLIDRARDRIIEGYSEKHHIIPRCVGGTDDDANIVTLTAREHFIAHVLLIRIYSDNRNLIHAANMMCIGHPERKMTNKLYGYLREMFRKAVSASQTGDGNSQWGTRWIHNPYLKKSKKIPKTDPLPEGWSLGRIVNFDKKVVVKQKPKKINPNILKAEQLYQTYKDGNFSSIRDFCRSGYYDKSHVSLTILWKKYIVDYGHSVRHGKRFIPR